jgi:hypothetical protein
MNITNDLENKIKQYLEFIWEQEEINNPEQESRIMNKLSASLKDEIYMQTNVQYLKKVPVLNRILGEKSILKLAPSMHKIRFSPEEFVFKVGRGLNTLRINLYILINHQYFMK